MKLVRGRTSHILLLAGSGLFLSLIAAFLFLPIFGETKPFTELDRNMIRLKTFATAVRNFNISEDGAFPDSLHSLVPEYLDSERFEASLYRDAISKRTYDWLYFGGVPKQTSDTAIIAASPSAQLCPKKMMHHRIVAHPDSRVEIITDEEFRKKLVDQKNQRHKGPMGDMAREFIFFASRFDHLQPVP